ncbi:hypothetical protein H8R18_01190 [Nanchangia anserum]|uniref:hypothetical protein n=1 Tax=Nanchangia anserum TaxID=2692125 RepID=UPI0018839A71|nr:hypothetical protein [Nanchangia anserum]QOX82019.1 hypothetical protein H8R18_01190 [Nanchangia anserum]
MIQQINEVLDVFTDPRFRERALAANGGDIQNVILPAASEGEPDEKDRPPRTEDNSHGATGDGMNQQAKGRTPEPREDALVKAAAHMAYAASQLIALVGDRNR